MRSGFVIRIIPLAGKEGRYADVVALMTSLPEGFRQEQEAIRLYTHAEFFVTAEKSPPREILEKTIGHDQHNLQARHLLAAVNLMEDNHEGALQQLLGSCGVMQIFWMQPVVVA